MEDFYIKINSELFSEDIDNLQFEPENVKNDSNEDAQEFFGY